MWTDEIIGALSGIYGTDRAKTVARNIIPSCMADFKKVLDDAKPEDAVEESYQTEDRRAKLIFAGERRSDGGYLSTVTVNGKVINAGVELK